MLRNQSTEEILNMHTPLVRIKHYRRRMATLCVIQLSDSGPSLTLTLEKTRSPHFKTPWFRVLSTGPSKHQLPTAPRSPDGFDFISLFFFFFFTFSLLLQNLMTSSAEKVFIWGHTHENDLASFSVCCCVRTVAPSPALL